MAGAGPRLEVGRGRGLLSVGFLWLVGLGGGDLREERDQGLHLLSSGRNNPLRSEHLWGPLTNSSPGEAERNFLKHCPENVLS